jgi:hypothetical protein
MKLGIRSGGVLEARQHLLESLHFSVKLGLERLAMRLDVDSLGRRGNRKVSLFVFSVLVLCATDLLVRVSAGVDVSYILRGHDDRDDDVGDIGLLLRHI